MKAYMCDICKGFYCDPDEDDRDYRIYKWNEMGHYALLDICPDCYAGFLDWIKTRKEVAMTGKEE